nr:uncharacterized protein LOC109190352 [Ipomoea batatas]
MDSRRRKRGEGTPKYGSDIEEHNVDSNTDVSDDEDYEDEVLEEFYDSDYDLVEGKKDDREFDKYIDVAVEYGGVQKSPVAEHGVEGVELDNDGVEGGILNPKKRIRSKKTPQPVREVVNEPVIEAVRKEVNEPVIVAANEPVIVAYVIAFNTQPEIDFDEAEQYDQFLVVEEVKELVKPTKIPLIRKKTTAIKAPGLKKPTAAVMKKHFTRSSTQFIFKFQGNENEPLEID